VPAPDFIPVGGPVWVDLMTSDTAGARDFYGRLLGWEAEDPNPDFGGYFNFTKDGARVAGCMGAMEEGLPDVWSVYLSTDDIARTVADARTHGGQVFVEPMPVGDLGTMAVLLDAAGATIGVWQPGQHAGFGLVAEPGAPSWFELHTREYETAVTFYRDVLRWEPRVESDTPEFRYTVHAHGDDPYAGIMDASGFLPEGVPPHWEIYFGTADTDGSVALLTEMGGSVLSPAEDTPYGRIAAVTDPTGAGFRLVQPPG
jgi:predicted enzyme related to lactoylglutathione lyase